MQLIEIVVLTHLHKPWHELKAYAWGGERPMLMRLILAALSTAALSPVALYKIYLKCNHKVTSSPRKGTRPRYK